MLLYLPQGRKERKKERKNTNNALVKKSFLSPFANSFVLCRLERVSAPPQGLLERGAAAAAAACLLASPGSLIEP